MDMTEKDPTKALAEAVNSLPPRVTTMAFPGGRVEIEEREDYTVIKVYGPADRISTPGIATAEDPTILEVRRPAPPPRRTRPCFLPPLDNA
jgi:hypothetical protein